MSAEFTRADILDAAAEHFGQKFGSPDQERDENGRWTSVGSAGGRQAEDARTKGGDAQRHREQGDYHQDRIRSLMAHEEQAKKTGDVAREKQVRAAIDAHSHADGLHLAIREPGAAGRVGGTTEAEAARASERANKLDDLVTFKQAVSGARDRSSERNRERAPRYRVGEAPKGQSTRDYANRIYEGRNKARTSFDEEALDGNTVRLTFASSPAFDAEPERRVVDGVKYVVGKPIHIFPNGSWTAVDERQVTFSAEDAKAMCEDLATRHSDVALTFDHETDKARGSEAAGWMPRDQFVFRADGLWNDEPLWCEDVYDKHLKTGHFRYLSGDALGVGSARTGDAFHPRRLLAASLVPKPGFVRGLKGITLGAAHEQKETFMAKMTREELCQRMGLSADASEEDFAFAFDKWKKKGADEPDGDEAPKAAMKAGADDGDGDEDTEDPNHTLDECDDPTTCAKHKGEKMGAKNETPATPAGADEKQVAEKFAALGNEIADKAIAGATAAANDAAEKRITMRFAADAQAKEVDALMAEALTDGRIAGDATAKVFRETFAINHEHGKALLAALPKPATAPGAPIAPKNTFVFGNGGAPTSREELKNIFVNPDMDPRKYAEQGRILTAVSRFSAAKQIPIEQSFAAVLNSENESLEREIFTAAGRTAEDFGGEYVGGFRAPQRVEYDAELAEFFRKRADRAPAMQQAFATLADFQPSAKTTLPMAGGYKQGEFIGTQVLPVFVGGADEKAAWPEFAFEKFAAVAQAAALLASPTRTSLNVIWHTVALEKFPVQIDIDRRARAASVTLPRGLDTIALENLQSQVGVSKEVAIATFMQTNGNYYDSSYYPSVTAWSSAGTPAAYVGLPMDDLTKGMAHVRLGVRAWPDLLALSPNAAISLRKNQQIIDTVRFTGTMERPGTLLSNSTLAAMFAGLLNLDIVVGEAGSSSLPSGTPVTDVWGNDAWLVCTGKGQIEAPRFGMTVGAAGSPRVRAFPQEGLGADGTDSIVLTDAWQTVSIFKKAAYWMKGASAAL